MEVKVKLLANYRKYLPQDGIEGNVYKTNVPSETTPKELLTSLGVPVDKSSVILVNGKTYVDDIMLKEGDVICSFPAMAGG